MAISMDAHEFIRQVIANPRGSPQGKGFIWEQILGAMWEVTFKPSPKSEAVLYDILKATEQIPLAPEAQAPHAMTPLEALQFQAFQALSSWDKSKHTPAIEEFAKKTQFPFLAAQALEAIGKRSSVR